MIKTLWLGLRVAAICVVIAWPLAWFVWQRPERQRFALLLILILPLVHELYRQALHYAVPACRQGAGERALLALGILSQPTAALMFNDTAMLVTMVVMYLPFVFLPIYLALERIPVNVLQGRPIWEELLPTQRGMSFCRSPCRA